ncbi:hypothetical protein BBL07_13925 [Agrobacterium vitis]|nr:hypothetical protein BBL07_13925 [Agrobacterium vitis]
MNLKEREEFVRVFVTDSSVLATAFIKRVIEREAGLAIGVQCAFQVALMTCLGFSKNLAGLFLTGRSP